MPSGLLLVPLATPFDHISGNVAMNFSLKRASDSASGTSRLIQACSIHRKGNENAEKLICQKKKKKKEPQNGEEDWGNWCCVCARAETRAIIKGSSLNGQCYSSCFLVIAASRLISPQQVLRSFSAMMSIYLRGIKEMWFAFTGPEVPCRLHWNHWVLWAITILWKVWNWAFCE